MTAPVTGGTTATVAVLAWLAVALAGGRADLLRATGHGSAGTLFGQLETDLGAEYR